MTKLAKLTSAIKKQLGRSKSSRSTSSSSSDENIIIKTHNNLRTVLVGKSRRRYLLSSDLLDHPLIRQLIVVDKATTEYDDGVVEVACEVVMFEHLLWMFENSDQSQLASSSMDELVDFYSY